MQKVVDNNNLSYKNDFSYDAETLKEAAEGDRFLWMSRYSGTEMVNERNAHLRNIAAHNTWQYYTSTKYYGVKAFAIEVTNNNNGRPLGNIYELDYNKHRQEVLQSSFNIASVEVTFKPRHSNQGAASITRSFDIDEFIGQRRSIVERYGEAERIQYNLSSEDEVLLTEILNNFKLKYKKETTPANIASYIMDMVRSRFHEYGYTRNDMAFTTLEDARTAIMNKIPVYVLHPDNTAEQIKTVKDLDDAVYAKRMLGMRHRDRITLIQNIDNEVVPVKVDSCANEALSTEEYAKMHDLMAYDEESEEWER